MRILKVSLILKRSVNKLYLGQRMKDTITEVDNERINNTDDRSRREAAVLGKIKRKFDA